MRRDSAGGESWSMACFIASWVALIMPWSSITSWGTMPIPIAIAVSWILWNKSSRLTGVNCLLSFIWLSQGVFIRQGRITAAATTGPARAPRPASSTPAMSRQPCASSNFSSVKVGFSNMFRVFYCPPAQNRLTLIEYYGLSGGNCPLRLVKLNPCHLSIKVEFGFCPR
ncbi:hypothetical protein ES703_123936 [subsurface metagenome]